MPTHKAVATIAVRAPLGITEVPTIQPFGREVRVKVEWTASTPLDLHQNDGGLFVKHPQILGDSVAGIVVEVGQEVRNLVVGDRVGDQIIKEEKSFVIFYDTDVTKVFGFCFEETKSKAQQEFVTVPETSLGKVASQHTNSNKRCNR